MEDGWYCFEATRSGRPAVLGVNSLAVADLDPADRRPRQVALLADVRVWVYSVAQRQLTVELRPQPGSAGTRGSRPAIVF
eukprot:SAG22_NODE_19335_length_276_cov_0.576271_1_plen_79_part_01